MQQTDKKSFVMGLVTGIAVLVVLGGVFMLGQSYDGGGFSFGKAAGNTNIPTQPTQPTAPTVDASKVAAVSGDDHIRGNEDAPITIIEYSDFECPFCARFHPTVQQILAEYPSDVRLVYRHFPLRSIHPLAQKAAEASECAADQDSFWEMHDKLFELNLASNLSLETMKSAAEELGLDTGDFNDCLDGGDKANDVNADYQNGLAAGVSGTPGSFVNGEYLAGALPFESIKQIIETKL